ncbi:cytochrome c oxidase, subunit II [Solimonas aquatica]|uniref:Cytochrome c oxidase subunit 2 n=1 Tax=Solimonas aquatica TaxID=489703 RepID=A0A1H9BQB1_9GAMM|nr:cytochrome c oxidase subunit II [Solimonas aquatica]SEP91184.1 cytochrome c oxidase, subunit II [Solimonas aquatica]
MLMKGWLSRLAAGTGLVMASFGAWAYTQTSGGYNMPTGVTEISHAVHKVHMAAFWTCVAIAVVVFGAMTWSIINHRRSKHPKAADFHESVKVEILWTIAPFVILISLAVPAAGTLIRMEDTRGSDMTVKVTGYQWKWQYEYLGENVSYFSTLTAESNAARQLHSGVDVTKVENYLVDVDNPLVLPVGKKIRFLITANDVIHAWWVPELAVKKDAIPGYVNEIWTKIEQPGTYRGVCAELCGRDHGFMPIVVKAVSEDEYKAFIAAKKGGTAVAAAAPVASDAAPAAEPAPAAAPAPAAVEVAAADTKAAAPAPAAKEEGKDELMKKGEAVYKANCAACHQANGTGLPPNFPSLVNSKVANGPADAHVTQILKGKNLMPPFPQLSDEDVAAVATYERLSWGNKGSVVQPAQVAALRK